MLTKEQLDAAGIAASDTLCADAALEWLDENTVLDVHDLESLPSAAKLFITKFCQTQQIRPGVASESIEGLSQSFTTGSDMAALIWDVANALLPQYLKRRVRFVQAAEKWR